MHNCLEGATTSLFADNDFIQKSTFDILRYIQKMWVHQRYYREFWIFSPSNVNVLLIKVSWILYIYRFLGYQQTQRRKTPLFPLPFNSLLLCSFPTMRAQNSLFLFLTFFTILGFIRSTKQPVKKSIKDWETSILPFS